LLKTGKYCSENNKRFYNITIDKFIYFLVIYYENRVLLTKYWPKAQLRGLMRKAERRIRSFLSGMEKLSEGSRNYIHKLTYDLSLVRQSSACFILEKAYAEVLIEKPVKHGRSK
jgi:hypothetical protein